MSRWAFSIATLVILAVPAVTGAAAQTASQPFVARANVSVKNDSPVPQTVTGTDVAPFTLLPQQQAQLDMSVMPPPVATAPGSSVPVQFEYSVGQVSGPRCHGTIDMSLHSQVSASGGYEVTNCVAHSLGTNGANCQIVVSAKNAACQGGLAFQAQ
jgi:hypothetical protein